MMKNIHATYAYCGLCLLLQVNVWCHTAIWLARYRVVPLWIALTALAIAMTLEYIRWLQQAYRPYNENVQHWEALKASLISMPAGELKDLLRHYERIRGFSLTKWHG